MKAEVAFIQAMLWFIAVDVQPEGRWVPLLIAMNVMGFAWLGTAVYRYLRP